MANAIIETLSETQTKNFDLDVTLDAAIPALTMVNLRLYSLRGNGTKDVTVAISGMGTTFKLDFTLPDMQVGVLAVSIGGLITRQSGSQMVSEPITSNTSFIAYDTTNTIITMTFGDVAYQQNGEIILPTTFNEKVVVLAKTTFFVRNVSGNTDNIQYIVLGQDTEFDLIFDVPATQKGSFSVDPSGEILKPETDTLHKIIGVPKLITFGYS